MTHITIAEIIANSDALKASWRPRRTWLDAWSEHQRTTSDHKAAIKGLANRMRHQNQATRTRMLWFESRADGSV